MGTIYLVEDGAEIARRRRLLASGLLVEAWQDLTTPGQFWITEESKRVLDGVGAPLPFSLALDGEGVAIYYGPHRRDVESLPAEDSLRARVLSAHGMAVAWITFDQFGERTRYEPTSPADPIFYLRRPQALSAHVWRLFRQRREAVVYMGEYYGRDPHAQEWADGLRLEHFEALLSRHGRNEVPGGA